MATEKRTLNQIAREIKQNWNKENSGTELFYGAKPYLDAMYSLYDINDNYGCDSGRTIVAYFRANSSTWRGEVARRIKAELDAMLKSK
jgi:hypothetical protein